ncbi:MAG: type II toxin-antitoxin system PemK/MazF family toxin [Caulobacteraceae bacterium]
MTFTTPSEKAALAAELTFGTVVLAPFPFTNQQASKKRPAVVVSSRAYAANRPDVIVMAVTSQLRPQRAFGEAWLKDWQAAGLLKPSAAKPVIASLEQGLILRRLGELSDQDQAAVDLALRDIIGRPDGLARA